MLTDIFSNREMFKCQEMVQDAEDIMSWSSHMAFKILWFLFKECTWRSSTSDWYKKL